MMIFTDNDHRVALSLQNKKTLSFSERAEFIGFDKKVDFRFQDLTEVDFTKSDIRGFDFTGANLSNAVFDNCIIDQTTCFDNVVSNSFVPFFINTIYKDGIYFSTDDYEFKFRKLSNQGMTRNEIFDFTMRREGHYGPASPMIALYYCLYRFRNIWEWYYDDFSEREKANILLKSHPDFVANVKSIDKSKFSDFLTAIELSNFVFIAFINQEKSFFDFLRLNFSIKPSATA